MIGKWLPQRSSRQAPDGARARGAGGRAPARLREGDAPAPVKAATIGVAGNGLCGPLRQSPAGGNRQWQR
jgi:hypothetical protein